MPGMAQIAEAPPLDETYTIPDLEHVREMFSPTEGLDTETTARIQAAGEEITELLKTPTKMGIHTVLGTPDIEPAEQIKSEIASGIEALELLDNFCENLCVDKCNGVAVYIRNEWKVDDVQNEGLKILIKTRHKGQYMGRIGGTDIKAVEVVIKTDQEAGITPHQINFRVLEENNIQVRSLRVDVHTGDKNEAQVDAVTGGEFTAKTHMRVESISGENVQENFRNLQYAFANRIGRVIAANVEQGNAVVTRKEVETYSDFIKKMKPEQKEAPVEVPEVEEITKIEEEEPKVVEEPPITGEEEVETPEDLTDMDAPEVPKQERRRGEPEDLKELRRLTKANIDLSVAEYLRKAYSEGGQGANGQVPDTDIILCTIFGTDFERKELSKVSTQKRSDLAEALPQIEMLTIGYKETLENDAALKKISPIISTAIEFALEDGQEEAIEELNKVAAAGFVLT